MGIKTIPLSQFEENVMQLLNDCADSGDKIVVELPDHRRISMRSLNHMDADDPLIHNLIQNNPEFRSMLARSKASGSIPFSMDVE